LVPTPVVAPLPCKEIQEIRVLPLKVKKKIRDTKENANESSSVYTILNRNDIVVAPDTVYPSHSDKPQGDLAAAVCKASTDFTSQYKCDNWLLFAF
jgi:hypothetical protein